MLLAKIGAKEEYCWKTTCFLKYSFETTENWLMEWFLKTILFYEWSHFHDKA